MKRICSRVRRFAATLLVLCTALPGLVACGAKQEAFTPQPGVTYTDLIADMNRQVLPALSAQMENTSWWGTTGRHITAYGAGADEPHLLVDIDMENETYTGVALTLPELADDLPALAAALQKQEDAAATGTTPARDIAQGYDVPGRGVVSVWETEDRQLYLLLEDKLLHYGLDATGNTVVSVSERALTLCNLAGDGTVQPVARLQLPAEYAGLLSLAEDCFVAPDGALWLTACDFFAGQAHLLRFSMTDGGLLSTLSLPENVTFEAGDVTLLSDGRLLIMTRQTDAAAGSILPDSTQVYVCSDLTKPSPVWDAPLEAPAQLFGQGLFGSFVPRLHSAVENTVAEPLLSTPAGIFHWDLASGEVTELLRWSEYAVQQPDLLAAVALPKGRYFVVTKPAGEFCLQVLTPLDPAALAARTVLTFGKLNYNSGIGVDPIEQAIAAFNAASQEYYIQIVDFEKLAEQKGYGSFSGYQALKEAILAHEVPDILMGVDESLLAKGLTIDLYPYLDADPALSREDFLPNLLALTEQDGALLSVMPVYSVETLAADGRVAGAGPGWTWQECQAMYAARDNFAPVYATSQSLYIIRSLLCSGDLFLDWQNGVAHFDTPAAVELLQNSALYPEEVPQNAAGQGPVDPKPAFDDGVWLLRDCMLWDWSGMLDPLRLFGEDCTFIGYPGDGVTNGSRVRSQLQLGISRGCAHPEAAWQLVRSFLLPAFQDTLGGLGDLSGFPIRRDSLEKSAAALAAYAEGTFAGDVAAVQYDDSLRREQKEKYLTYVTQADIDKVLELIASTTTPVVSRGYVCNIFLEEAEAYYAGQRSAEETAKIIQNRVQTYLDEQG